jgi:hypothetical protein
MMEEGEPDEGTHILRLAASPSCKLHPMSSTILEVICCSRQEDEGWVE